MTDEKALRVSDYLSHIIDAAQRIATYTAGMGREQFLASSLVQDAVIRNLEVIGEAARNIELADLDSRRSIPTSRGRPCRACATASRMVTTVLLQVRLPPRANPTTPGPFESGGDDFLDHHRREPSRAKV